MNLVFTVSFGNGFRSESYPWLRELLRKSELLAQILQASEVDLMLERHRAGTANFTRKLRALAAVAVWGTHFPGTNVV